MKIKTGNRIIALNTSGNPFALAGRDKAAKSGKIFLDCYKCDISIMLYNEDIDSISDSEAYKVFKKEGWSVIGYDNADHTLCPNCRK